MEILNGFTEMQKELYKLSCTQFKTFQSHTLSSLVMLCTLHLYLDWDVIEKNNKGDGNYIERRKGLTCSVFFNNIYHLS